MESVADWLSACASCEVQVTEASCGSTRTWTKGKGNQEEGRVLGAGLKTHIYAVIVVYCHRSFLTR